MRGDLPERYANLLIADINTAVSGVAPDSPAVKILSRAIPLL